MPAPNTEARVLLCRDFAGVLHLLHTNDFVVRDISDPNRILDARGHPLLTNALDPVPERRPAAIEWGRYLDGAGHRRACPACATRARRPATARSAAGQYPGLSAPDDPSSFAQTKSPAHPQARYSGRAEPGGPMTFDFDRFPDAALAAIPRIDLGGWPTPLQVAARLGDVLGLTNLLLKRDDVHPLGAGGNKLRKLEYHLGAAREAGADTVITFGALQTNHGRQTAAACAKLGLRCELVLTARVARAGDAYERSGNIPLSKLFGASVHVCTDDEQTRHTYDRLVAEATADGRKVATVPVGGSNDLGALGYVRATRELAGQLAARGIDRAQLVVPHASGGTAAGITLAAGLLGGLGVNIVCVSHPVDEATANLGELRAGAAKLLGVAPAPDRYPMTEATLGDGYGIPTDAVWEALRVFGRTEGVVLDPVYTGKVAAALVDWEHSLDIDPREPVVFLHTGGMPGLYGYAPELAAAVETSPSSG
jgi:D-cysteine desulfhydrase